MQIKVLTPKQIKEHFNEKENYYINGYKYFCINNDGCCAKKYKCNC